MRRSSVMPQAKGLVVAPDGGKVYLAGTKAPSEENHQAFVAEIPESGDARILTLGPGTASGIAIADRGSLFAAGFNRQGAFAARIDLAAWKLTALIPIGGRTDGDRARAIVIDQAGNPIVLGTAVSREFARRQQPRGKSDVFLARFDAKLQKPPSVTLFGGSAEDLAGFNGGSLKLDAKGGLLICGLTRSSDLPARGLYSGADDAFVAAFARGGRKLRFAEYIGGAGFEMLEGIAISPDGAVWATGLTGSPDLPSAAPGYRGGRSDAVLVRLTPRH